ncbi:uncharacterized protein LOC126858961 isoform X2 [Cataglyphis hispanica]|uniref:uncharacterized protein LOC126858961 isoform X2 n=1 Tax=Cataglyphis hispanica TaxID=1086592 RepID=UPI0021805A44|nr:uncharacterized protein LOC126858961 isoform X2 [Cataglyphis hispanica]
MERFNINDIFYRQDNILIGPKTFFPEKDCINIGNIILQSFMSNPNFIGQVDAETEEANTFQEMREKSVKCALWMQKLGIQSNDVIMICTNNRLDAYIPFLATLYIGAIVSPLDQIFNIDNLDYFLEQVKPAVLFINEEFYKEARDLVNKFKLFNDSSLLIIIIAFSNKNVQTTNEDFLTLEKILNLNYDPFSIEHFSCAKVMNMKSTAMKLFTSGTTAFPAQIDIPHSAFMAPSSQQAPNMFINDIALLFESLCYINGIFITIQAILLHVKIIRIKSHFTAEKTCQAIKKYKVSWIFLETNMCTQLIKSYQLLRYNITSLRTLVFSGSTANSRKIHFDLRILLPNVFILQAYSLTETGIIAYQRQSGKMGSCGYVSANVQLKIVDLNSLNKGQLQGPCKYGEIYCISPYMLTASKTQDSHDWFRTGDMGFYDEDGDIFIIDRINQLLEVQNYIISPTLIENLLHFNMAVFETIVICVSINNKKHAMALVKKIPGMKVTEMDIRQFVLENLGYNNHLPLVLFLEYLPHFSNGKINRRFLSNGIRCALISKIL